MQYLLNGGRNERGVLRYGEITKLYKKLEIKRVLFIVYALVEEDWQKYWQKSGPQFVMPGLELKALTLYDTDLKEVETSLRWADFIYLPGGSQATLLRRMHSLGTDKLLQDVIGGGKLKLFGGGSAGAMVMGGKCIVGHKAVNEVVTGLDYLKDCVVDSHFSERNRLPRLQDVINELHSYTGIGIDEDTAILLSEDGALQAVYGPGTVTVCHPNKKIDTYDQHSTFNS